MKISHLSMTKMFDMFGGRYSILSSTDGSVSCWIMEREWNLNRRNVSCIPRDEYILEPHNGRKYKNTYALTSDDVGHHSYEEKSRYACVIHKAQWPSDLEGCLCPAEFITPDGRAWGVDDAMKKLLAWVDLRTGDDKRVKIIMEG